MNASDRLVRTCRCSALVLTATGALIALGCQSDQSASSDMRSVHRSAPGPRPTAANDGEFAALMARHQADGIDMGRVAANRGSRADVRAFANRVANAQSNDSARLMAIARETGYADMRSDPDSERHAARCMNELASLEGAEFDRAYLNHMIGHHEDGVQMASAAMPNLRREDLQRMARLMINDQNREVAQMRTMLVQ